MPRGKGRPPKIETVITKMRAVGATDEAIILECLNRIPKVTEFAIRKALERTERKDDKEAQQLAVKVRKIWENTGDLYETVAVLQTNAHEFGINPEDEQGIAFFIVNALFPRAIEDLKAHIRAGGDAHPLKLRKFLISGGFVADVRDAENDVATEIARYVAALGISPTSSATSVLSAAAPVQATVADMQRWMVTNKFVEIEQSDSLMIQCEKVLPPPARNAKLVIFAHLDMRRGLVVFFNVVGSAHIGGRWRVARDLRGDSIRYPVDAEGDWKAMLRAACAAIAEQIG